MASVETNFSIAPPGNLEPLAMSSGPPALPQPDVSPSADRVVVALIDTAVQPQGTLVKDFLQPGISLFGDYQPPADRMTHGTAMAETLLDGVGRALQERGDAGAKVPVSILPIDIYGGDESTTTFDLARAMYDRDSTERQLVIRDIDAIAGELHRLDDAGVPVLWRPLHEARLPNTIG